MIRKAGESAEGLRGMNDEVNPAANHALHAKAERAAVEAWLASAAATPAKRTKWMERAAARVFKAAGTPADAAALYAMSVTGIVLERLRNRPWPSIPSWDQQ